MVIVEDSDFDGGVTIFGFKPKKGDPVIGQRVCMNCNGGMFTGIMQGVLPDDGATMRERLSVLLDTGEEREPYRRNVITLGPEPEISSVVIRSQPGEGLLNSELVVGNTIEYKKRKPSNKVHEAVVKKIIGDYGVRIKVVGIRAWQTVPMGNIVSIIHRQPLASI
jgi:hypothetical protein